MTSGPPQVAALSVTGSIGVAGAPLGDGALDRDVGSWHICMDRPCVASRI